MGMTVETAAGGETPARISDADRLKLFLFGGGLMLLIYFADPAVGLTSIPVSFFLKNRLHLQAHELAVFKLWTGVPLFLSFVFGFLRDRWSPFGIGDRGHLMVFGLVTGLIYAVVAVLNPTYAVLLVGLFIATAAFQVVGGAANGLISAIGQHQAMAGQMSSVFNFAATFPILASSLFGGVLSGYLEGQGSIAAARTLFLISAGLMAAIAMFGVLRPRALFGHGEVARPTTSFLHDIARLVKHWPIYPVIVIQMLWQFSPATGIVLQYHMSNTLHASDAQWGAWNAIFYGAFLPVFVIYGFLCQRVRLSRLLWFGFGLAVFQMVPLLFVHTAVGALIAAAPMGMIGGIAQAALTDLAIRSCPQRLQGTMMMLFTTSIYYFAVRFGDLFGTDLYDHHGGFVTAVVGTIIVYALILPVLLLVPKRLIATPDGQALATA
jgi:MFS family permease